jgi:hypothetical protein
MSLTIKLRNGSKMMKQTISSYSSASVLNENGEEEVFITYKKNPFLFWKPGEVRFLFNPRMSPEFLRLSDETRSFGELSKAMVDFDKLFEF